MSWKPEGAAARFAELVAREPAAVPIDEAMFLIAAHAHPELDVAEELARLDEMAAGCEPRFESVWRRLFVELGLTGEPSAFDDPAGSFLDTAIERRTGLPITLAVIAIEVGRRAGVEIEGVGMPHHFLARHPGPEPVLFDPFHNGSRLDQESAEALFRAVAGTEAALHPSHLAPVDSRQMLDRVLANLKRIYQGQVDRRSLAWVLELRTYIPGTQLSEHAQLAGVLATLGRARDAADLLEGLVPRLPERAAERARLKAGLLRATLN